MDNELKQIAEYYNNGDKLLHNCAARHNKSFIDIADRMESKFR